MKRENSMDAGCPHSQGSKNSEENEPPEKKPATDDKFSDKSAFFNTSNSPAQNSRSELQKQLEPLQEDEITKLVLMVLSEKVKSQYYTVLTQTKMINTIEEYSEFDALSTSLKLEHIIRRLSDAQVDNLLEHISTYKASLQLQPACPC
jgi:hypothetical protein